MEGLCRLRMKTIAISPLIFRSFSFLSYILNSFNSDKGFEGESCLCLKTHQASNFIILVLWEHKNSTGSFIPHFSTLHICKSL